MTIKINDLILDLLRSSDLSNQQIADKVLEQFPDAKTSAKSVASVASVARRFGVDVPKRPSASPLERIAELEAEIADLKATVAHYEKLMEKVA